MSPLLSNLVLDELDQELERRQHLSCATRMAARLKDAFWTNRSAELVWIPMAFWMLMMLVSFHPASVLSSDNRWHYFFWAGHRANPGIQTVTAPAFVTSVAYALGHFISRTTKSSPAL